MSPWPASAGHGDMAAPWGIPESCLKSATATSQGDQEPPIWAADLSVPMLLVMGQIRGTCVPACTVGGPS